ncbi:MAG: ComEC/Rec2 family competence protein [Desulfotomaculales bacterium]
MLKNNKRVIPVLLAVLLAVFLGAGWWAGANQKNELVLHFIDVGQGDSIFIKTPAGKNILIDAGGWKGEFESGKGAGSQVVVPYLRRLGVRKLDLFVITHPHEDHAGGAKEVAEAFPVNLAVISPLGFAEPGINRDSRELLNRLDQKAQLPQAYLQLLTFLTHKNIPVYPAMAGDKINCDPSLEITVLSPPFPLLTGTRSDENNASLAFLLHYKEKYILLGGDMEKEAQDFLCRSGFSFGADVLKVPHHGSRYSSFTFFEKVKPKVAVITVGARNQLGLPAKETLDMLKRLGAEIFRTDEEGALIITTDGDNLQVKSSWKKRAANF